MADAKQPQGREGTEKQDVQEVPFDAIVRSPVPKFYFNGVGLAFGTGDVTIVLNYHNGPVVVASASYETAKTLATNLLNGIKESEKSFGMTFPTLSELAMAAEKKGK